MDRNSKVALLAGVCLLLVVASVQADSSVTWVIDDLTTTGGDVFWTSPTAIDPDHLDYNYTYNITKVEAQIPILGWQDVTSQVPSGDLTGSGTESGPCPIELYNESFSFQESVISVDATVHAYADSSGYGHMDMTGISLSGVSGLRLSGSIDVTGVGYPVLPLPGVHYTLQETLPGSWEVRSHIIGDAGTADTAGLSAYEVWVDGVDNTQVSFAENTLSTVVGSTPVGFQPGNLIAGEATNGSYNLGNYQEENDKAILGVGLTDVLVNEVDLDADALLGVLTTPTGLDEANFRAGAAGLFNAAGDGFLNTDGLVATLEVIPLEFLLGDANHDGVVSAGDYTAVQANFGNTGAGILGDANYDGVVSAGDYASIQANFGNTAASTLPEPVTLSLLALGGIALIQRQRK